MSQRLRVRQWRVYCGKREGSGLFVYTRVFATKAEMLAALRAESKAWGTGGFANGTQGAMQSFKSSKRRGCIGCVNLFRGGLWNEYVVHEFTHAMFAWAERKRLFGELASGRSTMPTEELMCYALGRMVARFGRRAHKLGLL